MIGKINKYINIINLDHHTSSKHPRMPIYKRAAQFAPFAALTGYHDEIKEASRITINKRVLINEEKLSINNKLKYINDNLIGKKEVLITYYVPDKRKTGGKYINKKGIITKIDLYKNQLVFENKDRISIKEITKINI